MKEQLQAIVTVLSLVNPAICGMLFAQAEVGRSYGNLLLDATKAALSIFVILVAAALAGTRVLDLFGVSLDAFMVAGGGVLAWMGFSMLSGQASMSGSPSAPSDPTPSLTPLILFAASPGTITGVITISAAHTRLQLPTTALVAIGVATATTWLVMLLAARLAGKQESGGFMRDTISRLMGLVVLSMGVQFALTGFHAFAP
ncbi:MAG: MarC family protein [Candidatus Competibacteraceae bacterium]|nr:MAG: MarC family protein [Candidatus Competibacteraceae bacterium]